VTASAPVIRRLAAALLLCLGVVGVLTIAAALPLGDAGHQAWEWSTQLPPWLWEERGQGLLGTLVGVCGQPFTGRPVLLWTAFILSAYASGRLAAVLAGPSQTSTWRGLLAGLCVGVASLAVFLLSDTHQTCAD
jgi:hypothetical protein